MTKQEKEKLKGVIAQGKWNFILVRGMLLWGGLTAFLIILFDKFILGEPLDMVDINVIIIIFLIGGLVLGYWTWSKINKKYQGLK